MLPFPVPLTEVNEAHLQALIDAPVPESQAVEYKRELPASNEAGAKELARDIAAMANASGGVIIFGIGDEGGVPTEFFPIDTEEAEKGALRIQSVANSRIEPQVYGLCATLIPLAVGGAVVVTFIPGTISGPHLIRARGAFVLRRGTQKLEMDVAGIRAAFVGAEQATKKLSEFRAERLAMIKAGAGPRTIALNPILVVHFASLDSFAPGFRCDLSPTNGWIPPFLGRGGYQERANFNFDGYLGTGDAPFGTGYYSQLFRTGVLELVSGEVLKNEAGIVRSVLFEFALLQAVADLLEAATRFSLRPPFYFMPSLLNTAGLKSQQDFLDQGDFGESPKAFPIKRANLVFPEVAFLDFSPPMESSLRETFDMLAHACEVRGSVSYDNEGNYRRNWRGARRR